MVSDARIGSDGNDGKIRALGGHGSSGNTRSSLTDDGVGVDSLGEAGGGSRNRVVDTRFLTDRVMSDGGDAGMVLGIEDDLFHGLDGL